METEQPTLSKSQLAETIITTLSLNKLGYIFFKSNGRYYYFKREAPNQLITDMMVVSVYFRRGLISCALQSRIDSSNHYGAQEEGINRNTYLFNSKFNKNIKYKYGDPSVQDYCFRQSVDSLNETLQVLLADLEVQGCIIVKGYDERLKHPKFLCAMAFIKELQAKKEVLTKQLGVAITNWSLGSEKHPVFKDLLRQLLSQLEKIEEKMETKCYDPLIGWRKKETRNRALALEAIYYALLSDKKKVVYWWYGWHYV